MAWQLLAAALPYAAQAAGQYITRPREEEYKPQTGYMKKYLSYLRGRQAGREVQHMAMQPALRSIGAQGRKMQRDIGYQTAKAGVAGSGIEAQQRLSAGQMTLQAIQEAGEKATAAQMVESRRLGERAEEVTAKIGAEETRAQQAYQTAQSQWKRQMVATGVQAAGAVAGTAITQAGQLKSAKTRALQSGMLGDEKAIDALIEQGFTATDIDNSINRATGIITSAVAGGAPPEKVKALLITLGYNIGDDAPAVDQPPVTTEAAPEGKEITTVKQATEAGLDVAEITTAEQARGAGLEVKEPVIKKPEGFIKGDYSTYPIEEIEGVKYHVDLKGEPVMSIAPETPKGLATVHEEHLKAEAKTVKKEQPKLTKKQLSEIQKRKGIKTLPTTLEIKATELKQKAAAKKAADEAAAERVLKAKADVKLTTKNAERLAEEVRLAEKAVTKVKKTKVKPSTAKLSDKEIQDYFKKELGGIDEFFAWEAKAQKELGRKFGTWQEEYDYYIQSIGGGDFAAK